MARDDLQEAEIYVDRNMSEGEVFSLAAGDAAVYSARAPNKETGNEDSAAVIPFNANAVVLVVADGVGGMPAGAQASGIAVCALRDAVKRAAAQGGELRDAILNGIENANRAIIEQGSGAATTLAAVAIQDCTVRPYHVGDSMILVAGQKGKVKLQTVSHSPVGYAIEAGLLDESEAMHHEERHVVSNVLGTADMRIEVGSAIKLAARDTLIIATDGLFDNLHLEEIIERARKGPLPKLARGLAEACRQRMARPLADHPSKPDDLTFIAFRRRGAKRGG